MAYWGFFTDFIRYMLESCLASFCFVGGMERKRDFPLRVAALLAASVLLALSLAFAAVSTGMGENDLVSGIVYTITSLLPFAFIFSCMEDSLWNRLFCCLSGSMLRMGVKKIFDIGLIAWEAVGFDPAVLTQGEPMRYIAYYLLMAAAYGAVFLAFRHLFGGERVFDLTGRTFSVYLVVLLINMILNYTEPVLLAVDVGAYTALVLCEFAYYILILYMQWFLLQKAHAEMETQTVRELWQQDKRQYELTKETIDIINIKCHDLRHQLQALKAGEAVDSGYLQEVERSVSIYDSAVKTGNETLDVILTDKRLRCEAGGIQLTCMADGGALWFMEQADIICLFGNAIENAMEYVSGIDDAEKRFISLAVRQKGRLLSIHVENYFEGALEFHDGLPVTRKEDRNYHGYGVKSMRFIAKKYGGDMEIVVRDGLFQLNILIPMKEN